MKLYNLFCQIVTKAGKILNHRHAAVISFVLFLFYAAALTWMQEKGVIVNEAFRQAAFECFIALGLLLTGTLYLKSKRSFGVIISKQNWLWLIPSALLLRLALALLGHNYDLESFEIVGEIVGAGKSVYGHTDRYNYGPVWAWILAGLKWLSETGFADPQKTFHVLIVFILFAAELFLYRMLYLRYKDHIMILLLLFNPVSLVIIGHHSQFDVLAIAVAYAAYRQFGKRKIMKAVLLLGLSLSIKHIMVFLPLLFVFDKRYILRERLMFMGLPAMIFAAGFLPYLGDWPAIVKNVFSYQFNHRQTLLTQVLNLILPPFVLKMKILNLLPVFKGVKLIWLALFPALGLWMDRQGMQEKFMACLLLMVASSPAVSEQYFLIPLAAVFRYRKLFFSWLYLAAASYYILFVSFHNTARYFGLKNMGLDIEFDVYQLGMAQVQLCLAGLLVQILYRCRYQSDSGI